MSILGNHAPAPPREGRERNIRIADRVTLLKGASGGPAPCLVRHTHKNKMAGFGFPRGSRLRLTRRPASGTCWGTCQRHTGKTPGWSTALPRFPHPEGFRHALMMRRRRGRGSKPEKLNRSKRVLNIVQRIMGEGRSRRPVSSVWHVTDKLLFYSVLRIPYSEMQVVHVR